MSRQKKVNVLVLLAFFCAENFVPDTIGHVTQAHWSYDPNLDHDPALTILVQNILSTEYVANAGFTPPFQWGFLKYLAELPTLSGQGNLHWAADWIFCEKMGVPIRPSSLQSVDRQTKRPVSAIHPFLKRFKRLRPIYGPTDPKFEYTEDSSSIKFANQPEYTDEWTENFFSQQIRTVGENVRRTKGFRAFKLNKFTYQQSLKGVDMKTKSSFGDILPGYLMLSNLKRARDGYMCFFKLCQVGVSDHRQKIN